MNSYNNYESEPVSEQYNRVWGSKVCRLETICVI